MKSASKETHEKIKWTQKNIEDLILKSNIRHSSGRIPERIEDIIELIRMVWNHHPNLRFTELIGSAILEFKLLPYYLEDDEFLKYFTKKYQMEIIENEANTSNQKTDENTTSKSNEENTNRIDTILDIMKEAWLRYPDMRFLQLIGNLLPPQFPMNIFIENITDENFLDGLKRAYHYSE